MAGPVHRWPEGGDAAPDRGTGPSPGGLAAAAERLSHSIAGGYGLRDRSPTGGAADPVARRRSLRRLGATFALVTAAAVAGQLAGGLPLFTVEVAVAVLIAVIMLHELGHLLVAKRCGIKVTEYFVGFGPRLWSIRRGETEYGIKPVLIGGYVRIIGMNDLEAVDPADEARAYRQQVWYKRVAVSLAGPAVHFVLAFVLLYVIFAIVGVTTVESRVSAVDALVNGQPSPAQIAGFQVGDRIVSVDGRSAKNWNTVRDYIQSKPGVPITFVVDRDGQLLDLAVTPRDANAVTIKDTNGQVVPPPSAKPVGVVGIEGTLIDVRTDPLSAVGRSTVGLIRGVGETVAGVGRIFSPHELDNLGRQVVTGQQPAANANGGSPSDNRPVSPIGIGRLATQAASNGFNTVLELIVVVNLFLGVFNLIPLLPFDGGHVAIAVYERVRSRKGKRYHADINKMLPVTYALLMVVAFLGLSAVYLDLAHPIANPFR